MGLVIFSKMAAREVIMAMENAGLDSREFALYLGRKGDDVTLTFVKREANMKEQHGLCVEVGPGWPPGFVIDYGEHNGKRGLFFLNKR